MADIRINSLPSTATSFNTDDYIAIDGASAGTRKMLAATLPLTDVTFGTSGPSAKSSIAARAARQGLVFDGTAGATVSVTAVGSTDFTIGAWVRRTSAAIAGLIAGNSGSVAMYILANGTLRVDRLGTGSTTASTGSITSGKDCFVCYVRSGTTGTYYIDGLAAGTTSDSFNYSTAIGFIGGDTASSNVLNGKIAPAIYNRALSAAEVVSLYEAGVPSGADYNTASNTTFVTGFTQSGSITSFTANATSWSGTGTAYAEIYPTGAITSLTVGKRYRLVVGTVTGTISATGGVSGSALTSNTTYDFTATGTSVVFSTSTVGAIGITGISLTRLGLLLAPDAAQAGGGLTWYDTSGNAANITLPASGVSWNVPTSASFSGGWSFGSGGGNVGIGLTNPTSGQLHIQGNSDAASGPNRPRIALTNLAGTAQTWTIQAWQTSGDANLSIYRTAAAGGILLAPTGGNVLIGTTTDGGQKLQVNGTAAISGAVTGSAAIQSNNGTVNTRILSSGTAGVIGTSTSHDLIFQTGGSEQLRLATGTGAATFAGATTTFQGSAGNTDLIAVRATTSNGSTFQYKTGATLNWYHGLRGLVNNNWYLFNNATSTNTLIFDAATDAATFAGNLTVNGTGTSIFAGNLRLPWASPSLLSYYDATYSLGLAFDSTNRKLVLRAQSADAPANGKGTISFETGATPSEIARFAPSTGNLLLKSDGIDSANGKLQLATHTTSAGGIGFGTDTSLFRSSAGILSIGDGTSTRGLIINGAAANAQVLLFQQAGTEVARIGLSASTSLLFATGANVTALTLDSSQNAIFAGSTGVQLKNDSFLYFGSTVRTAVKGNSTGSLELYANNNLSLTLASTGAATFAGQLTALGISHTFGSGGTSTNNALITLNGSSASNYGAYLLLQRNSVNKWSIGTYSGIQGGASDDYLIYNQMASNEALRIAAATSNATFTGAIAIGNTVQTASSVASTHKVTISIGGVTYYLLATNV